MPRIPCVLTIAGSDSGGGAGIQADLKTFAALGVHGLSAVTAVTAQNTSEVRTVFPVPAEVIRQQIRAVTEDIGVDAVKTGMLPTIEAAATVASELRSLDVPIVVDPVMKATTGSSLMGEGVLKILKEDLIPQATLVTPNKFEAEALTGLKIGGIDDVERVAERLASLGAKAVLIKGGHILAGGKAVDFLLVEGEGRRLESERLDVRTLHGTGCVLSSAVAAHLAKGESLVRAVELGKEFVSLSIRHGLELGKGNGLTNPMARLYNQAERYAVLENVSKAVAMLEESDAFHRLVPELQVNIGMSLPYPQGTSDVVGIPGRIVKIDNKVKASSCPRFGGSKHVAKAILAANELDPTIRAAMNVRHTAEAIEACQRLGLKISSYDRREEPEEVKAIEGGTIPWGTRVAMVKLGSTPDIIYHDGDWGKEPMIEILGVDAVDVAGKALRVAEALGKAEGP
jgi:hydroxymethylpyrimidine/phosphomethylpyrimidine kinase